MIAQADLFSAENLAASVEIPRAPELVPHEWPFPGMTPEDSARAAIAMSEEYYDMLAAVIKSMGGGPLIGKQVKAMIPSEWLRLVGDYAHTSLDFRPAEQRGIKVDYVSHDDGGFHFSYRAIDSAAIAP